MVRDKKHAPVANQLDDYEAAQVGRIAAWKSSFPNPFGELLRRATYPLAKSIELIIPDAVARRILGWTCDIADAAATGADIKRRGNVADLAELRHKPLQFCDDLALRVGIIARGVGTVEGALTGAGGVWTALLDLPLLFGLCIRTIVKIGHCYGYHLDRPEDRDYVLGVLAIGLSESRAKRQSRLVRLREIEDLTLEETEVNVIIEECFSLLTQIEFFEDVPIFGAAAGGLLNLFTLHRVDLAARRLFQERWLRDNGKVERIEPAEVPEHILAIDRQAGAIGRAAHGMVYAASFAATFPFYLAGQAKGTVRGEPAPMKRSPKPLSLAPASV